MLMMMLTMWMMRVTVTVMLTRLPPHAALRYNQRTPPLCTVVCVVIAGIFVTSFFKNTTQYWFLLMLTPAGPCYN